MRDCYKTKSIIDAETPGRRHKHLCMIPVRGEPCVSCKTRRKECTFSMPPTARKRKPRPPPTSAPSAQAGSASASTSAPSTSSAGAGPSGSTPTSAHQQTPTAASSVSSVGSATLQARVLRPTDGQTVPGHTAFGVPTSNLRLDPSLASGEWMTSPFVQVSLPTSHRPARRLPRWLHAVVLTKKIDTE